MLDTRMTNQKHICILNPSPMIVIQVTQENSHKEIVTQATQKLKPKSFCLYLCNNNNNNNNNNLIDFALSHAYGILTVGQI